LFVHADIQSPAWLILQAHLVLEKSSSLPSGLASCTMPTI
jgi:hypothetical protein